MMSLDKQQCEACQADAPTVSAGEQATLMKEVPDWDVIDVEGVPQLRREFKFRNFVEAQAFTNKVADLAEEVGHHPAILLEFGKVTVRWWTHKIHGLHRNDFIMAARTDTLFG